MTELTPERATWAGAIAASGTPARESLARRVISAKARSSPCGRTNAVAWPIGGEVDVAREGEASPGGAEIRQSLREVRQHGPSGRENAIKVAKKRKKWEGESSGFPKSEKDAVAEYEKIGKRKQSRREF
jgi:hypothetical protein